MVAKDTKKRILDDIDAAYDLQKDQKKRWRIVTEYYNGDYTPEGFSENDQFVKSHNLFIAVRELVSTLILPADFRYRVRPPNPDNALDVGHAKTAQAHLEYFWRKQDMWRLIRKILIDSILYNRGYVRIGFRPHIATERNKAAYFASFTQYGGRMRGQPFLERIKPSNFMIAPGFESIKEAEQVGGYIIIESAVHIDWIKNNEVYFKHIRNQIEPDVTYKNRDIDALMEGAEATKKDIESKGDLTERKYAIIQEIFYAPTPDKPFGETFVAHKHSKNILFEADELPFDGMGFPVNELIFFEPQDEYYGTPLAQRSINPLQENELFETKILDLLQEIKSVLVTNDRGGSDNMKDQLKRIATFGVLSQSNFDPAMLKQFDFNPDVSALERASLRSLARFKSMFRPEIVSPLVGDKVATEMRLKNVAALSETNDSRTLISSFAVDLARKMLIIAERNTTEDEQRMITRQVDYTFESAEPRILKGDYNVVIETSPILDMTQGEEFNMLHALLTDLINMESNPKYTARLDSIPILKQIFKRAGYSSEGVFTEGSLITQESENKLLILGIAMPVQPTDNHLEHIQSIMTYKQEINQAVESPQVEMSMDEQGIRMGVAMLDWHVDEHIKIGEQQSAGSLGGEWKQIKNAVNQSREAGGNTPSSAGAGDVQKRET